MGRTFYGSCDACGRKVYSGQSFDLHAVLVRKQTGKQHAHLRNYACGSAYIRDRAYQTLKAICTPCLDALPKETEAEGRAIIACDASCHDCGHLHSVSA